MGTPRREFINVQCYPLVLIAERRVETHKVRESERLSMSSLLRSQPLKRSRAQFSADLSDVNKATDDALRTSVSMLNSSCRDRSAASAEQQQQQQQQQASRCSWYVTVAVRGELTHKMYQAWEANLGKRLSEEISSPLLQLSVDLVPQTRVLVLSPKLSLESFHMWLGGQTLSDSVSVVSCEWVVDMIKLGHFLEPQSYALNFHPLSAPEKASTVIVLPLSAPNREQKADETKSAPTSPSRKYANKYACIQSGDIISLNANRFITDILEELQSIYELIGDEWRSLGYKKCISLLKQQPRITHIEQLNGIKGIGSSIREKIVEILDTGRLSKLEHFRENPKIRSLMELSSIWGVGEKTASQLMQKGFHSLEDLRVRGQHLLTRQQQIGLKYCEEFKKKIPRVEVEAIRDVVAAVCEQLFPGAQCTVCGSYRRGKPQSGDVDILIGPPDNVDELPGDTLSLLVQRLQQRGFLTDHLSLPHGHDWPVQHLTADSESSSSKDRDIPLHKDASLEVAQAAAKYRASYMGVCLLPIANALHRRIDIKVYPRALIPFAILYFTGSDHFNRSMRLYAKKRGFSLSDKGLVYEEKVRFFPNIGYRIGEHVPCSNERDIFDALQLPYKSPAERNVFDVDHLFSEEERLAVTRKSLLQSLGSDSE